jgi:hypothetical protein
VWFQSDVADDMPWKFTPTQEYVTVHPGESVLAFFTAHNRRSVRRHMLCFFFHLCIKKDEYMAMEVVVLLLPFLSKPHAAPSMEFVS